MRIRVVLLSLLFCCVFACPAWSQVQPVLYVSAGGAVAQGPERFQDFYGMGPHVSVGAGVALTPDVEIMIAGRYSRFQLDDDGVITFSERQGGQFPNDVTLVVEGDAATAIGVDVNAKFSTPLTPRARFYFSGGGGLFQRSVFGATLTAIQPDGSEQSSTSEKVEETGASLNFGLGLSFSLSEPANIYVEPRYRLLFAESSDIFYLPIQVGLSYRL